MRDAPQVSGVNLWKINKAPEFHTRNVSVEPRRTVDHMQVCETGAINQMTVGEWGASDAREDVENSLDTCNCGLCSTTSIFISSGKERV